MGILPNSDSVYISESKINGYALNPEREPNKAAAFREALGYDLSNAEMLINNIRENIKKFEATRKQDNGYGIRYEVIMTLTGENGKRANVKTAWIVDGVTGETRLISAYVTKKRIAGVIEHEN